MRSSRSSLFTFDLLGALRSRNFSVAGLAMNKRCGRAGDECFVAADRSSAFVLDELPWKARISFPAFSGRYQSQDIGSSTPVDDERLRPVAFCSCARSSISSQDVTKVTDITRAAVLKKQDACGFAPEAGLIRTFGLGRLALGRGNRMLHAVTSPIWSGYKAVRVADRRVGRFLEVNHRPRRQKRRRPKEAAQAGVKKTKGCLSNDLDDACCHRGWWTWPCCLERLTTRSFCPLWANHSRARSFCGSVARPRHGSSGILTFSPRLMIRGGMTELRGTGEPRSQHCARTMTARQVVHIR